MWAVVLQHCRCALQQMENTPGDMRGEQDSEKAKHVVDRLSIGFSKYETSNHYTNSNRRISPHSAADLQIAANSSKGTSSGDPNLNHDS